MDGNIIAFIPFEIKVMTTLRLCEDWILLADKKSVKGNYLMLHSIVS